ncbi:hypothetical protein Tco_0771762 [Tanacetum coccineum]|uniref:Uncharacterized protein n=1 Tax=Tanacetum coccineum TaxID=301880 RepID=A0ABQ4ZHX7_9ASTR
MKGLVHLDYIIAKSLKPSSRRILWTLEAPSREWSSTMMEVLDWERVCEIGGSGNTILLTYGSILVRVVFAPVTILAKDRLVSVFNRRVRWGMEFPENLVKPNLLPSLFLFMGMYNSTSCPYFMKTSFMADWFQWDGKFVKWVAVKCGVLAYNIKSNINCFAGNTTNVCQQGHSATKRVEVATIRGPFVAPLKVYESIGVEEWRRGLKALRADTLAKLKKAKKDHIRLYVHAATLYGATTNDNKSMIEGSSSWWCFCCRHQCEPAACALGLREVTWNQMKVVAEKGDKCEEMEAAKEKKGCGEEMAITEVDAWFQMVFANDVRHTYAQNMCQSCRVLFMVNRVLYVVSETRARQRYRHMLEKYQQAKVQKKLASEIDLDFSAVVAMEVLWWIRGGVAVAAMELRWICEGVAVDLRRSCG